MLTIERFKTTFWVLGGCIFGLIIGFFVGRYDIYMAADCHPDGTESIWYPHAYNMKDALYTERRYCNDMIEMLHMYWQYKDYESYDEINNIYFGKHNYWLDCISESQAYMDADSINHGDWEDFFVEWLKYHSSIIKNNNNMTQFTNSILGEGFSYSTFKKSGNAILSIDGISPDVAALKDAIFNAMTEDDAIASYDIEENSYTIEFFFHSVTTFTTNLIKTELYDELYSRK